MSSDDLFNESVGDALAGDLSPHSLGSTPIDCSGVVGAAAAGDGITKSSASNGGHVCVECEKTLRTRSGLKKHMVLHKLNHYNSRKPFEENIEVLLPVVLKKVLTEIQEEPAVALMGVKKKEFVSALATNVDSPEISLLVSTISSPIMDYILVRKKVMPSSQYEEALKKVNVLLSKSEFFEDVKDKLLSCVPEELRQVVPDSVLRRLVWRMTTKFMFQIQEIVFHQMKEKHVATYQQYTMQEREVDIFRDHIGKTLRAVFKFGVTSKNPTWSLRCKSMRERFVDCQEPLTDDQFLNSKMWEGKVVTLSAPAFNIFLGIERIIQNLQNNGSPCNATIVFDSLTNVENLLLLNNIRDLSSGIMSEDLALSFFEDLIKNVVALSGKLEASRKLQMASKKQKPSNVSLRTNLKRNPTGAATQGTSEDQFQGPSTSKEKNTQERPSRALAGKKSTASLASPVPPVTGSAKEDSRHPTQTRRRTRQKGSEESSVASPAPPVAGQSQKPVAPTLRSRTPKQKSTSQEATKPARKSTRTSTKEKSSKKK